MQYIPLPSKLQTPKQFIPHSTDIHLPYTIMPSTKPLAHTMFRSTIRPALQLTDVTLHQTNILEQHKIQASQDCVWLHLHLHLEIVSPTHKDGPFRTKVCIKSNSLYSCYPSTIKPTGLWQYGTNMLTICTNTNTCQQTWAICQPTISRHKGSTVITAMPAIGTIIRTFHFPTLQPISLRSILMLLYHHNLTSRQLAALHHLQAW